MLCLDVIYYILMFERNEWAKNMNEWFRCGRQFEEEDCSVSVSVNVKMKVFWEAVNESSVTKHSIAAFFLILLLLFSVEWIHTQQLMHSATQPLLWCGSRLMSSLILPIIQENRPWKGKKKNSWLCVLPVLSKFFIMLYLRHANKYTANFHKTCHW